MGENLVCALIVKQAPLLIDKWKSSASSLLFHDWLVNYENDTPIKGVVNKLILKNYDSAVGCLIALWLEKQSDVSFDVFLHYHHTRANG